MPPPQTFLSPSVRRGDYYFLDLDTTDDGPLQVVCGGREVCGADYLVDRPGFRWWSVEYVESGHGLLHLGNETVELSPGSVFSYGPGRPHRIEVGPGSTLVKYFVDFSGVGAEAALRAAFPPGRSFTQSAGTIVPRLFEDLGLASQALGSTRAATCAALLRCLLTLLPDRSVASATGESALLARFHTLKATLAELAPQRPSVEAAARACGVSTSYLERLFRQFDHESPQKYLQRCRMALAASWLLDDRLLVKEVASLAGYEDQYHFSRCFKTVYGRSPEAFRTLRD